MRAPLRGRRAGWGTLTALRAFRDGYMTRTVERRALVEEFSRLSAVRVGARARRGGAGS